MSWAILTLQSAKYVALSGVKHITNAVPGLTRDLDRFATSREAPGQARGGIARVVRHA